MRRLVNVADSVVVWLPATIDTLIIEERTTNFSHFFGCPRKILGTINSLILIFDRTLETHLAIGAIYSTVQCTV